MKRLLLLILLFQCVGRSALCGEPQTEWERNSEVAQEWFFKELPRHLVGDLHETFWNRWHLAGLAGGIGLTLGLHQADNRIQGAFHPEDPMGGSSDLLNILGNNLVLGSSALATTAISALFDAPRVTLTAGTMLEALVLTNAIVYPIKFAVGRGRPDGSNSRSFPSAHAAGSFAFATVVEVFYGPWYGIPSYALAGAISLARLDANKHFASDTAAGALIGTLIGLGTATFHKNEKKDLFVMPTMLESGAGIQMVRLF